MYALRNRGLVIVASMALLHTSSMAQQGDFRPPTATEVFNLRSRCAQLGEKIMEDSVIGVALTQSQVSRYDLRTNRCYVELTVETIDKTGPQATYYRRLIDGQTKENLAWVSETIMGKSGMVFDKQYNRGKFGDTVGWDYATSYIDQMMAEDRR
jgi:hypothetical protein